MEWVGIAVAIVAIMIGICNSKKLGQKLDRLFTKEGDTVKPPTQELEAHPVAMKTGVVTATISHPPVSKAAAQKRLDKDTKKVGYVRGEVYQLDDGGWGIAWGGKYPL